MYTELPLALSWAQSSVGSQVFSEPSGLLLWLQRTPLLRGWLCNPHLGSRTSGCLEASILEGLLLLLLSRFSHVQLCETPETAAHQAPMPLGFSRQEHWSGLPFPSPMHESEKWKWSRSVVSDSVQPHRWQPTRLPCPWDSPGKNIGVSCRFLLQWMKVKSLSRVRLLTTPWTAAHQAPPSMGFSRQEYWSGVPLPSPYYAPNNIKTGIHTVSVIRTKYKLLHTKFFFNFSEFYFLWEYNLLK